MAEKLKGFSAYDNYAEKMKNKETGGLPAWDKDASEVFVWHGELACRYVNTELGEGICGNTFNSRGALVAHIKKDHGADVNEVGKGNPKKEDIFKAKKFYTGLKLTEMEKAVSKAAKAMGDIEDEVEEEAPPKKKKKAPAAKRTPTKKKTTRKNLPRKKIARPDATPLDEEEELPF